VPGILGSGHPYADFLFGVPTSVARAEPPNVIERKRWTLDLFVQDDWRLTPDLTLNLGLRYDYHPLWEETNGLQAVFDLKSGAVAVVDDGTPKVSRLMPRGYVPVVSASEVGLPADTLVHTDGNNFSPRLGVALRPFGRADFVLRGGYGLAYDMTPIDLTAGGVPFVIAEPTYTNALPVPVVVLPRVFPAAGTGGPTTVQLPNAVNPDLQMPVTQRPDRDPFVVRGHDRTRHVVHARYQRAGARRPAVHRQAAALPELPGDKLCGQRREPCLSRPGYGTRAPDEQRLWFSSRVHPGARCWD